jgi:putative oxidoreductase
MQRLFSTFPNSWPGLGLLILRLATGFSLAAVTHVTGDLAAAVTHVTGDLAAAADLLERCLVGGVVVLLWIGLWTPIAAVTEAAIQIGTMSLAHQYNSSLIVTAAVGFALAMLGPGAWSLDARLFGRKRIV